MLRKSILSGFVATGALLAASPAGAVDAVTTDYVNMRQGPAAHTAKIKVIPSGVKVEVKHCLSDRPWCQISYRGDNGWTSARFIDTKNPHSIPLVHGRGQAEKSAKAERTSYTPSQHIRYETSYVREDDRSTRGQSGGGLGQVIAAPFKAAANLVTAPFNAISGHHGDNNATVINSRAVGVTEHANSVQDVSYPERGKTRRIIIEQQLPPVYVKEKDLNGKNFRTVSYGAQTESGKAIYIPHERAQHVSIEEPHNRSVAYVEKAPVRAVSYHHEPQKISREVVVQPHRRSHDVEKMHPGHRRAHTGTISNVQHISYKLGEHGRSYGENRHAGWDNVSYKETTTRAVVPASDNFIDTSSAPMGRFDRREAQKMNISYRNDAHGSSANAYNPGYPTDNLHNKEFHRNETRY